MIKHLLTVGAIVSTTFSLLGADNLNLMPWVNGTEWTSTEVEKSGDAYIVYVNDYDGWNGGGAGIDFTLSHTDFSLAGYIGVHIDVTTDNAEQKHVYINYKDGTYDEYNNQGQAGTYLFSQDKQPYKIVFKYDRPCTQTMYAFTLLAPNNAQPVEIASGNWQMNSDWGQSYHIEATSFATVKENEELIIHYSANGGAQGQIFAPKVNDVTDANNTAQACHLYTTTSGEYNFCDLTEGNHTVTITLTEEMVKHLKARGLTFCGKNVTFTKVEHIASNPTIDVPEETEPALDPVNPGDGSLGGVPVGIAPKEDLPNLFDGNAATLFRGSHADRAWAGLDLGEKYVITKIKWMTSDDEAWKVNLGVFEGANSPDFMDALPLYIIRETNGAGQWNEAIVNNSAGFRYVRYVGPRRLTDANANDQMGTCEGSHGEMAELRFFGEKGEGDNSNLYRLTNLPTVVINTVDMEEPRDKFADPDKEHNIVATLSVIDTDGNLVTAPGITRERGNYSRTFPKRPLRMKFDKKNKPLPEARATKKKWELLNNFGDKTLMRNLVAFDIAKMFGMEWVPFCAPVDVILNGEYRGCYQLTDSKEVDPNRVNIHEMTLEEAMAGDDALSGGYFIEIDAYADQEPEGTWFRSEGGYTIPITVKSPNDGDVMIPYDVETETGVTVPWLHGQTEGSPLTYITDYFSEIERRLYDGKFTGAGSYRELFDVESFLQLLMVNEVAGNKDIMWSFNMYKDANDPYMFSGPAWDFDVAFDNSRYITQQAFDNDSFLYKNTPSVAGGFRDFTDRMMEDEQTLNELRHLWGAARDNGLSYDALAQKIDEYATLLDASQKLNFAKWPILSTPVHDSDVARGSYAAEVAHIKDFLQKTISHFDKKLKYKPGEHTSMVEVTVDNTGKYFTLTVPYGHLKVKDEVIQSGAASYATANYAADATGFVNSANEWKIDKEELTAEHRISYYAVHAGRQSAVETVLLKSDGSIAAVETIAVEPSDNAPREYFTLTGVRVTPGETTPGVYICRQGSKVTKVVLH